jgi:NAD(P)-dependent dehydrogenase (short-subunit alcohol dehydrogenase family)
MAEPRFAGKVAVITGAAGGIGSAVARRMSAEGALLALVDRDAGALAAVAGPLGALAITADVTVETEVQAYVQQALAELGGIHLFFNNAGIEGTPTPLVDLTAAAFDTVMAVNTRGVFLGLREVLRVMQRQGQGGAIVNTASQAGIRGGAGMAPYIASKHAVIGLTKTAALEAAPFKVRVNAVAPGFIDTRMMHSLNAARSPHDPAIARRATISRTPWGRMGTADEVAALVTWLLSDDAEYITGSVQLIDGGVNA